MKTQINRRYCLFFITSDEITPELSAKIACKIRARKFKNIFSCLRAPRGNGVMVYHKWLDSKSMQESMVEIHRAVEDIAEEKK